MSSRRFTLSDADADTLMSALNRAMDDRASFAGCWPSNSRESKEAAAMVRKYERLHVKLFGGASARQVRADYEAALPRISIFDLQKRSTHER